MNRPLSFLIFTLNAIFWYFMAKWFSFVGGPIFYILATVTVVIYMEFEEEIVEWFRRIWTSR